MDVLLLLLLLNKKMSNVSLTPFLRHRFTEMWVIFLFHSFLGPVERENMQQTICTRWPIATESGSIWVKWETLNLLGKIFVLILLMVYIGPTILNSDSLSPQGIATKSGRWAFRIGRGSVGICSAWSSNLLHWLESLAIVPIPSRGCIVYTKIW